MIPVTTQAQLTAARKTLHDTLRSVYEQPGRRLRIPHDAVQLVTAPGTRTVVWATYADEQRSRIAYRNRRGSEDSTVFYARINPIYMREGVSA